MKDRTLTTLVSLLRFYHPSRPSLIDWLIDWFIDLLIYWLVAWHHTAPQKNMYIISHQHHQTSNQLHFLGLFLDVSSLGKTAVQQKYLKIQIWVFAVTLKTQFTKSKTSCILWDYLFLTTKFFWICRFGGWNCHFFQRFHSKGLPPHSCKCDFSTPINCNCEPKKIHQICHSMCFLIKTAFQVAVLFRWLWVFFRRHRQALPPVRPPVILGQ